MNAAQEGDVLLPRLAVDADAFNEDSFQTSSIILACSMVRIPRLRFVLLPADEHENVVC